MNNHTEKLALLLGKFDDGQISDFEMTELTNLIDNGGDAITNSIDNLLSNITPEINQSQLDYMDNYLDNLNNNFATSGNNFDNLVNNQVTNNPSNLFNGFSGFSLNSSIIGIKVSSILTSIGMLSIASVAYFAINWNNDKLATNENQTKTLISKSNTISENKIENQTDIIAQNNSEENKSNLQTLPVNESISKNNNSNLITNELFSKEEKIVYSEELVSLINQNNTKINELILKLKADLKFATDNNNDLQQVNILYQLGVIYRIKNISAVKSVELLDKAKEIALSNKTNINLILLSDIYGELYKSNTLLKNSELANTNLNNCIKILKEVNSNNKTKITSSKLNYWNNEANN